MQTVQEFYGATWERASLEQKAKLEAAHRQFNMALKSENPSIQARALEMAAKTETSAYA